jgi:hypothetical protein
LERDKEKAGNNSPAFLLSSRLSGATIRSSGQSGFGAPSAKAADQFATHLKPLPFGNEIA